MTRKKGGLYGLNERQLPPKPPSKWRWPVRIFCFFGCVIAFGLFMLSRSGGSDEGLRRTVESMLTDISGYRADVKILNGVSFYPVLGLDVENATLYDAQGAPVVRAANVNYSTGFWSTVFSRPSFRTIGLRDVAITAGTFTPKAVVVETLAVVDYPERNDRALLQARGLYGGEAFDASLGIKADLSNPYQPRFSFDQDFEFRAGAGPLSVDVVTDASDRNAMILTIKNLGDNRAKRSLKGALTLRQNKGKLSVTGPVEIGQTALKLDMLYAPETTTLEGNVTADKIYQDDLTGPGGIADMLRTAFTFYAGPDADILLGTLNADLKISAAQFISTENQPAPRDFNLIIRNGVVQKDPLAQGEVAP